MLEQAALIADWIALVESNAPVGSAPKAVTSIHGRGPETPQDPLQVSPRLRKTAICMTQFAEADTIAVACLNGFERTNASSVINPPLPCTLTKPLPAITVPVDAAP